MIINKSKVLIDFKLFILISFDTNIFSLNQIDETFFPYFILNDFGEVLIFFFELFSLNKKKQ